MADKFIFELLRPMGFSNMPATQRFIFDSKDIIELTTQCQLIVKSQPMLIRTVSPVKIFGDIHGQYSDLMRFFYMIGGPCNPEI